MQDWNNKVKRLLKSELVKRGISTGELALLLNQNGIKETKSGIDSKISRGTFSAAFFMQCLSVIGCKGIQFEPSYLSFETKKMSIEAEPEAGYQTLGNEK